MTKSPLERAARALCELEGNPPGATMDGKPLWMDYLSEARVVIAAIREPSEKMIAAGRECASGAIYQRMIDALLEQP
jgi:hypothetical protein